MKYDLIVEKIADQSLTLEEFNSFIAEAMGGSIKERVRRRSRVGMGIGIDNRTGHSRVKPFDLADRVHPKKRPIDKMNNGATKPAHDQSTRTQRRKAAAVKTEGKLDTLLKLIDDQKITVTELHDKLAASNLSVFLMEKNVEEKSDDRTK